MVTITNITATMVMFIFFVINITTNATMVMIINITTTATMVKFIDVVINIPNTTTKETSINIIVINIVVII